jgi:hydroxymethylpyrimidine pyrophosphatase-like HAD family hydrolase
MTESNYRLLAFDYDETLATAGEIRPPTFEALAAAKAAGWQLALVTGRPHEELLGLCPGAGVFDMIVDENGGVLFLASTGTKELLADRPDPRLRQELKRREIWFVHGDIVTITRRPHERETMDVLRDLGLDMDTYCNRLAIMIVPRGTSKATGLKTGLARLGVAAREVIAFGDDQNDVDFLRTAGLRVALANATDAVKAEADLVTDRPNGDGIARFIYERVLGAPESLPVARGS